MSTREEQLSSAIIFNCTVLHMNNFLYHLNVLVKILSNYLWNQYLQILKFVKVMFILSGLYHLLNI